MNQRMSVTVEAVGNGFIVRPYNPGGGGFPLLDDVQVFQDMGYASAARDNQATKETLLGFIEDHFRDKAGGAETMNQFGEDLSPQEWHIWNQNRLKEWEMEKEHERMMQAARAKRGELTAEDQSVGTAWAEPHDHRLGHTEPRPRGWFARFIEWVGR